MIENTTRSVVEEYCSAWMAGDTLKVLSLYHEDLVLTWPGNHHLAGVHDGQAASTAVDDWLDTARTERQ